MFTYMKLEYSLKYNHKCIPTLDIRYFNITVSDENILFTKTKLSTVVA